MILSLFHMIPLAPAHVPEFPHTAVGAWLSEAWGFQRVAMAKWGKTSDVNVGLYPLVN